MHSRTGCLAALAGSMLIIGCKEGREPLPETHAAADLDSREAPIGIWKTAAPLNGNYFVPYVTIVDTIIQLAPNGDYISTYYLEVDGNGATGTLFVRTTGRWDRYEDKIMLGNTQSSLDLIDYQSRDASDQEIYSRMEQWRDSMRQWPLNNAKRIRRVTANELILIDGVTNVLFVRAD